MFDSVIRKWDYQCKSRFVLYKCKKKKVIEHFQFCLTWVPHFRMKNANIFCFSWYFTVKPEINNRIKYLLDNECHIIKQ